MKLILCEDEIGIRGVITCQSWQK